MSANTSKFDYDVIVIGAGPAGCTAATVLAQKKRRVLVLEKDKFPRYHIGESLIPYCYFPLQRIGLIERLKTVGFVKKQSVQFISQGGRASQPFYFFDHFDHEANITWQVDRAQFDLMMMENAREKGARVLEETRVKNTIDENGQVVGVVAVHKNGETATYRAPITIDCSGRDGLLMNRNRWRIPEPGLKKTAIWTYYQGAERDEGIDEGATTIAYLPAKGWFWYIPLHDDKVSVGVVADKEYLFDQDKDPGAIMNREIEKNSWIKDRLAKGRRLSDCQVTGDYSYRSKYSARDGVVLAGDAYSFLDPVFSSGVFLALASGEMVADTVDHCLIVQNFKADQFDDYSRKLRSGIEAMRKFIYAFYDLDFNARQVIKKYPNLGHDFTDCLIGNVFKDLSELFRAFGEFIELPKELEHGRPLKGTTISA